MLDEPSIGLHPSNIVGLNAVMHDLIADGNSIILVDHDTQILSEADWLIEMGPEAGAGGGYVITQGTIPQVIAKKESMIGPFLAQTADMRIRKPIAWEEIFAPGKLHLSTDAIHTVKPLEIDIPKGRLTVVTGVSGSGKTTMVLESLIPGLEAKLNGEHLPGHVKSITAEGIAHVKLIDASPIGINVRSTVATYANVHDELRKIYAKTADAKNKKYKAGDFSYNTGKLRCPVCDGTGQISLDVQFLPDVDVPCPESGGVCEQTGETLFSAADDGDGCNGGIAGDRGLESRASASGSPEKSGTGIFNIRRRDTKPLRRGGSAVEACQRNGKGTVGFRICIRRTDDRTASVRCTDSVAGILGAVIARVISTTISPV